MNGGDERDWLIGGFWVGDWLALPSQNRITRSDQDIVIEPKVMEVLVCLARQPGRTVTKDFFFDTVWDGTVVTDDVLSRCISELRRNLGDDSRNPKYIETIRKTGYRLIAPVSSPDDDQGDEARVSTLATAPSTAIRPVPQEGKRGFRVRYVVAGLIVVAAAIGFFAIPRLTSVQEPPPNPSTVPFTSFPGLEVQPAFSPEGTRIAFAAQDNSREDHDIFVMQEGSYDPLRLTEGSADETYPVWSPDGLFLAFVRTEDGSNTINRIASLGGQERVIADLGGREIRGLAWSPDGGSLVISAQTEPFGPFGIFTVRIDSANLVAVTHPNPSYLGDITPAISPAGNEIAFARAITEDLQNVYVKSLETGQTRQVTSDSTSIAGLTWMSDGRSIIFSTNPSRGSALWRVDAKGGKPTILASAGPGTSYESPSVTADGKKLAFAHRHSSLNIWRIFKPKGLSSFRSRPAISSTSWDSYPDISPDGMQIAFASDQSGRLEIWLANADGSNQVKLTDTDGGARAPTWSPDGTEIAFELRRHGQTDIWTIASEGGVPRQVTRSPFEEANPKWSRDGTALYFASNRSGAWELWRMSLKPNPPESSLRQITRSGGRFGSESPDGLSLYFVRPDTTGIWVQKLKSDRPAHQIFDELDTRDWGNWSITPSGFYFVQRKSYTPALAFYFLQSRRTIRLLTLDDVPSHPSLAVAPDFSWFAYTQIDEEGSDILVMEGF